MGEEPDTGNPPDDSVRLETKPFADLKKKWQAEYRAALEKSEKK